MKDKVEQHSRRKFVKNVSAVAAGFLGLKNIRQSSLFPRDPKRIAPWKKEIKRLKKKIFGNESKWIDVWSARATEKPEK